VTFSPSYTTPYSTAEEQAVEIGAFGVLVDGRGFITDGVEHPVQRDVAPFVHRPVELSAESTGGRRFAAPPGGVAQVAGVVASRLRAERCRP